MAWQVPARAQRIRTWFQRNRSTLLLASITDIILLLMLHIFTSIVPALPAIADLVQVFALVMVSFIFITIIWRGVMPAIICMLGIVLMHNSIILPFFPPPDPVFPEFFYGQRLTSDASASVSVSVAVQMHFFLGLAMVVFSIITAYRPSMFFTKNRPASSEDEWSSYPTWYDNVKLAGGFTDKVVPATSLMTDKDRYLLWRYEFLIAVIYGRQYIVRPSSMLPKSSEFVRDKESGLIIGKPRFTGYFM